MSNSLETLANSETDSTELLTVPRLATRNPPPWITKLGTIRWEIMLV